MEYNGHKVFIDNGYPAIYLPDNPNSKSNGTIRLHVLEMQKKLNRPISPLEVIHHKDENKENYDINNLICFATSSDHIAYHKGGPIVFDKEGIARCVEKKTIKINGNLYNKCPKCSKLKSLDSFLYSDCYKKENIKRPSYEELVINYELLHTYSAIGKKYGVSDNAVKKWFKFYKINKKPYYMYDIPDRNLLLNKLNNFSLAEVSRQFGVNSRIIHKWIKELDITYIPEKIICVETKCEFNSRTSAIRSVIKNGIPKSYISRLNKAIETGGIYEGFHWKIKKAQIY